MAYIALYRKYRPQTFSDIVGQESINKIFRYIQIILNCIIVESGCKQVTQFSEECQTNEEAKANYDYMKEKLQLDKQLAEFHKENDFQKNAAAFFAKKIEQRFIDSAE